MKINTERGQLLRALQIASGVVERRQTLPILGNLKLVAKEGQLSMIGTDLEVELEATLVMDVERAGEVTVPARKIADIWKSLPSDAAITMEVQGTMFSIRCGQSKYSLATISAGEYPDTMKGDYGKAINISTDVLKSGIEQVAFAMAQQDVRYFLNGMLFEIEDSEIRLVATDGHRLAMTTISLGENVENVTPVRAILPRKGVLELLKLFEDGGTVKLSVAKNLFSAEVGAFRLVSKLVEGQFPDYKKVVPAGGKVEVVIDRVVLREALQRASILSNEKYRGIRMSFKDEQLKIQANNPDQEEAEEVLEVGYGLEPIEIGFNVSYLLDVLSVVGSASIKMTLSDGNSSALVEAADDSRAVYVVMPMRL